MGSPIRLCIVPNCGLQITVTDMDLLKQDDSVKLAEYELTNLGTFPDMITNTSETFKGWMSPVSAVTLPKEIKKSVGIAGNATKFAYLHPPAGLGDHINWEEFHPRTGKVLSDGENVLSKTNEWAIPYIAIVGGYAYFDENNKVVCINALSLSETEFPLPLSGPFETTTEASEELQRLKRVRPLSHKSFYEINFVAMASILPNEKFRGEAATKEYANIHGAFTFFRDNGTSLTYAIEPSRYVKTQGATSELADVFVLMQKETPCDRRTSLTSELADKFVLTQEEIHRDGHIIRHEEEIREAHNICHEEEICKAHKDKDKEVSEKVKEIMDKMIYKWLKWTPLHYICRFMPNSVDIIKYLIKKDPDSVYKLDYFKRQPIHIACDSGAEEGTILMLVEADKKKETIQQKTKFLHRLPIHIACNKDAKFGVIEQLLLHADKSKELVLEPSKCDRYPLHLALRNRLVPYEIIKLLLDDDGKVLENECEGMIPLHIACWNNSRDEIVSLLLEKDKSNVTVNYPVNCKSLLIPVENKDEPSGTKDSINDSSDIESQPSKALVHKSGTTVSLHLAVAHGDLSQLSVINLLLKKERARVKNTDVKDGDESIVHLRDTAGQCPLHIACVNNVNSKIVKELLAMDQRKITAYADDDKRCKPIHYACAHKKGNADVVQLLLKADDYVHTNCKETYYHQIETVHKRSTHSVDKFNRSPLHFAVKNGAQPGVLEMLMSADHFFLKGFDNELVSDLADTCSKSRRLQAAVIDKIAERCYISLLFVDVYTHLCVLTTFLVGSDRLLNGELDQSIPTILSCCIVVFMFREFMQLKAQTTIYFSDFWCWTQLATISLLCVSTRHMQENVDVADPEVNRSILTITGVLLITQFMLILRSTFLPFASFVGGLLLILSTLIPFFIVSFLVLMFFAYSFRMSGNHEGCDTFTKCYYTVLVGFFSGAEGTEDYLDVMFGVLAIIVLLNVVIAIVCNAWESAQRKADHIFWRFRLQFLTESRFCAYLGSKVSEGGIFEKIGKYIDETKDVRITDNTEWLRETYEQVRNKEMYENPHDHFDRELADKIESAQSLRADLYWARMNDTDIGNEENKKKDENNQMMRNFGSKYMTILKWLCLSIVYGVYIILGLVTAGFFWPRSLRCYILSIGMKKEKTE